jgi:kynurenine formamidase
MAFNLPACFVYFKKMKGRILAEEIRHKWIDLSYDFSDKTLYWPTASGFKLDTAFHGVTDSGFYYEAYNYCAAEHGGTHLDAPSHFAKGKWIQIRSRWID